MENDKIVSILKLVATTLQTDYESTKESRKAVFHCLEEIDKAHIEITGQQLVKRQTGKTIMEAVCGVNKNTLPIK